MILVVDDDPVMLAQVCDALRLHGLTVEGVPGPREALAWARRQPPALVISDVVMPDLTGFELRRAYADEFPERATPFLFLSSLDDPASIVAGLDAGADDFLVKPVAVEVLVAKIRVALRRQHRRAGTSFRGDLASLGLPALLRFCEAKGLTGYLDVFAPERVHTLRFTAGRLDDGEPELDAILGLARGAFVVHSLPLDFGELAGRGRTGPVPILPDDQPVGRVSGVRLHQRLLQVQTELVGGIEPVIVTLVTIGGRPQWKQRTACPPGLGPAALQARLPPRPSCARSTRPSRACAARPTRATWRS